MFKGIVKPNFRSVDSSIFTQEEFLIVKNITTEEEKIQAYHLRHRVFCEELGWLPQREDKMEIDDYDKNAVFFGVFNQEKELLAFLRAIKPEGPFMIEKEFSSLVRVGYKIRKEKDTIEISRLCVVPEARNKLVLGNFGHHFISSLLYRGVYLWCVEHNIKYLYVVVELKVYRLLGSYGFSCRLIGEPKRMPDGILALAGIIDIKNLKPLFNQKEKKMALSNIN